MRIKLLLLGCLGLIALSSAAKAQAEFPSVKVAKMAGPSVVAIDVNSITYGGVSGFGGVEVARTGALATRHLTGFVLNKEGYIVTDSSDLEDAALITVYFNDGTEARGEVIGVDEFYGVGVVKVDPADVKGLFPVKTMKTPYDPFKDTYPYDQGDNVVAIGYSGGFGGTVTYGIISAIRNFRNRNGILLPSVIQSDVVINTGNEGSPLFNEDGVVIGVHELRGGGGSMQNTTFFTPINVIERAANEIIADSKANNEIEVWHPWLGMKPFAGSISPFGGIREFTDDLKMYINLPQQYWDVGVPIDIVYPESPAREFGLMDKDILMTVTVYDADERVKFPYTYLRSLQDLELLVTTADEGDIFLFGVYRDGKLMDVEVEIGQHPSDFNTPAVPGYNLTDFF